MTKAIVLLSGGLDSATNLALAHSKGHDLYVLSFNYGQRHKVELEYAKRLVATYPVIEHKIAQLDLTIFGGSSLTADLDVPKDRSVEEMVASIPNTYVPARNTVFLSYALAWADVLKADKIYIGVNALDYAGYPDCRPEFVQAFQNVADVALQSTTEAIVPKLQIESPLINLNKEEIIQLGASLSVNFKNTSSCYDPDLEKGACGRCDACILRRDAFMATLNSDPTFYRSAN